MYFPKNSNSGLRAGFYLAATWAWLGFRIVELKLLRPLVRSYVPAGPSVSAGATTSTQTRQRAARAPVDPTQTRFQVSSTSHDRCSMDKLSWANCFDTRCYRFQRVVEEDVCSSGAQILGWELWGGSFWSGSLRHDTCTTSYLDESSRRTLSVGLSGPVYAWS